MNFTKLIQDLAALGWSQHQIAEECGVTQGQISSIKRGQTKAPRYALGVALVELAKSGKRPPPTEMVKAKAITAVSVLP
jgi:transcriptional regulator with XRE-family HTH domain